MRPPPRPAPPTRRGTFVPALAITVTGILSFVALAIDLGVLTVARTECQNAADAAALVATRNLDNKPSSPDSNRAEAEKAARQVVQQNVLLKDAFKASDIESVKFGTYDYDTTDPNNMRFKFSYNPPATGRSWTATEVTVKGAHNTFFGNIFGVATLATNARAVAVHRPRDLAVIMDMTGSMKFGSMIIATTGVYLSPDPLYPQMGPYQRYTGYRSDNPNGDTNASSVAARSNPLFTTEPFIYGASKELYAPGNHTVPTAGGPPSVKDFYYDPANLSTPGNLQTTTPSLDLSVVSATDYTALNPALDTPPSPLPRGFHHWNPGTLNPGNPDDYVAPTYDYSGWTGVYNANNFVVYPTPETFKDQSHASYVGDRFPRKKGVEWDAANNTATWAPTDAKGSAVNLAEYLGWVTPITGTTVPNPGSGTAGANMPAVTANAGGRVWASFYDRTWETYGYDLDVSKYVANRPAAWDPRSNPSTLPSAALAVTAGRFKGYSMGPGYWGKTFVVWPPDPRAPVGDPGTGGYVAGDWRRRFFLNKDNGQFNPQADNNAATTGAGNVEGVNEVLLRNGTGAMTDGLNADFKINYPAVLKWLKQKPMALPPNLRSGRVLYYSSIPDTVEGGSGDEQADRAFWKNYIDYVINGSGITSHEGRGWPEGATPGVWQGDLVKYSTDPIPYMHYLDNPSRPRAQFWFGPVSMLAFLANGRENAYSGTTHESQTWQLKAGMNSALDDIRNNHPNDSVGFAYFSFGDYGNISVALGQEWKMLKAALFYPQSLVNNGQAFDPTKEFRAYDGNNNYRGQSNIPNAQGGTDPNTGLAMGYNILTPSPNAPLPTLTGAAVPPAGTPRRGRRGASKVVVFETDGVPNSYSNAVYTPQGFNSYYKANGGGTNAGNGDGTSISRALEVVDKLHADVATTTTGDGGLGADVYAVGFGDLFSTPGALFQTTARQFLLDVQKRGGTSGPGDTAIPDSQIITGGYQARIDKLRTCFERIMQSGVQVTLIE